MFPARHAIRTNSRPRSRSGVHKTCCAVVNEINQIAGVGFDGNGVVDYIGERHLTGDPALLCMSQGGSPERDPIEPAFLCQILHVVATYFAPKRKTRPAE